VSAPAIGVMVKTLRCRWRGIADFDRWADLGNHNPQWDHRTVQIADLIPAPSRIVEFGAGRRQLERYLPQAVCTLLRTWSAAVREPSSVTSTHARCRTCRH
jgi:hypothetical protein